MLQAGFIILTLIVSVLLLLALSRITQSAIPDEAGRKKFLLITGVAMAAWLVYVGALSIKGVFLVTTFPPRVPLLLVLPLFAFTGLFFGSGRFKNIITQTPASWPVYFQAFRIAVELLLLMGFKAGIVPREGTFDGYNFDIVIGLAAPLVGYLAFRKEMNRPLLLLYNISGLATLATVVFIFMSTAYAPAIWHKPQGIANLGFGLFPYTYLAGYLMPVAVFMHGFSLVKRKRQQRATAQ
ncbi:MAG: hypothetical protein H7257_02800 [Taibaiella sp.]|nr:hypothetical protein [Taibaiella sp.]